MKNNNHNVCFVIPAYNEEKNILSVIEGLKDLGDIIIIDDGSKDNTGKILKDINLIYFKFATNMGYDAALNKGFEIANSNMFNYIITVDADGQHKLKDIKKIRKKLIQGYHVVSGKRNILPRFGEKLFSLYTKFIYKIDDPLCGLKGYNINVYNELGFFDNYKSIGTQLLLFSIRKKYKYYFFEIDVNNRINKLKPSFGGFFKSNYKILRSLFITISNDVYLKFTFND